MIKKNNNIIGEHNLQKLFINLNLHKNNKNHKNHHLNLIIHKEH